MNYYPEFAEIVEETLVRQDRSPSWLAQRLGVSRSTVNRWLNHGVRPRNPETVARLADVLGITSQRQLLLAAAGYGYQDFPTAPHDHNRGDHRPGTNLPAPVTSLIGRETELADIAARLDDSDCRLLTLWGMGGIGKTRLALAAAQAQVKSLRFPDGVYFATLGSDDQTLQVVPAIAATLGLPIHHGDNQPRTPEEQLLDFLRGKRLLLVLDNLEHLPQAGGLITRILEAARGVKVLATSRERLRLPGERLYPLAGLSYPAQDSGEYADDFDAPRLFLERARQVRPDFVPDASETTDLDQICRAVDGMPLALELAAAWADTLALHEILGELEASLDFLTTDAAGVVDRHRSMDAVFDASWQRLTEQEQRVFARLSIFHGGFTREAAEQVADATLPVLSALVGKSFVRFRARDGRYDIHELMRQYGADRLAERIDEGEGTRSRHSAYFCELLEWSYEEQKGQNQLRTLSVLDAERGNLQVAWDYALAMRNLALIEHAVHGWSRYLNLRGDVTAGWKALIGLAEDEWPGTSAAGRRVQAYALGWLVDCEMLLGHFEQVERHLETAHRLLDGLAASGEDVRFWQGMLSLTHGIWLIRHDADEAIHAIAKSLALAKELGLPWEEAISLAWLGRAKQTAEHPDALEPLRQAEEILTRLGDRIVLATVLEFMASYHLNLAAEYHGALETALASLELRREIGDPLGTVNSLTQVGHVYNLLGQPADAEIALNDALAIALRLGDRASECAICERLMVTYGQLQDAEKQRAVAERGLALATQFGDQALAAHFEQGKGGPAMP
jgi:predicted ATPase